MNERDRNTRYGDNGGERPVKVPPSDYQAEQAVLGAILLDSTAFAKANEFVHDGSFYWEKHARIFRVMHHLFDDSRPTDLVTVSAELKAAEQLENVGGDYYLTELSEAVPFPRNVDYYARIVKEKYLLREVSAVSEEIGERVYDPAAEPEELLDWTLGRYFDLQRHNERSGYRGLDHISQDAMEEIERIAQRKGSLTGIGSGFPRLDEMTGGFQTSDLIVLAARPSMGKTALALCFAFNASRIHKIPVGVISLEMSAKQIAMRLMSLESHVPLYKIRTAKGTDEEWMRIGRATSNLAQLPIFIDDTPSQTITDVRARARLLRSQHKCGMIILDYLQLMQPPSGAENQQQAIAQISRQLKGLSKELEVPVVALSQLSRAVETRGGSKRPILSDLRDSGAIEQDADVVMFVYRQAYYDRLERKPEEIDAGPVDNTSEVIVAKQRNGPTGTVKLVFRPEFTEFANLEASEAGDEVPEDIGSEVPF